MKKMGSTGAMALGMVFALAGMAWADDVPGVYATGVDADGLVAAQGTADLHWDIVQSDDPGILTPSAAIVASPHPAHFSNDAPGTVGSSWIAASSSTASRVSEGDHHFQSEVDLTTFDAATAVFTGRFASDNEIVDVLVNGVSQGIAGSAFNGWTDFTLTSDFVSDVNAVTFVVNNQGDGAMGFRLEWSGTADPLPIVEPEPEPEPETGVEAELVVRPGKRAHPLFRFGWCSMPVAVLSTSEFDATALDPATVELSGAQVATRLVYPSLRSWFCAKTKGWGSRWRSRACDGVDVEPEVRYRAYARDVNGDGIADLVLRFRVRDLLLVPGTNELELSGLTTDGTDVTGTVEVTTSGD